jgi:methionyl-tRNA formyltransferase
VATGDGVLRILELQPEGKRVMTAREFLAGHVVRPGVRFA